MQKMGIHGDAKDFRQYQWKGWQKRNLIPVLLNHFTKSHKYIAEYSPKFFYGFEIVNPSIPHSLVSKPTQCSLKTHSFVMKSHKMSIRPINNVFLWFVSPSRKTHLLSLRKLKICWRTERKSLAFLLIPFCKWFAW